MFEKSHSDVLKDIDKLLGQIDDELIKCHFKPAFKIKYINHTQYKIPYYILTKDGFALLAMSNKVYTEKAKIDSVLIFSQTNIGLAKSKELPIKGFCDLFLNFENIFKVLGLVERIVWIVFKVIQLLQLMT